MPTVPVQRQRPASGTEGNKLSYRINEAADAIGISRSKLYELIRAGEVHTFDLFGRKLIRREELQALIDRCSGS